MRRLVMMSVMVVAVGAASLVAQVQSKQANIKVTANVIGNCLVTTGDVAFGNYDPVGANAATPADATGYVELTCSQGVVATIAMGGGQNYGASSRRMVGPNTAMLNYALYQDANRTTPWLTNPGLALGAAPSTAPRRLTVYGRLPAGQDQPVGSYLDTVLVTVTF